MTITQEKTLYQSQKTFDRWKDIWLENAKINKSNFVKQEDIVGTKKDKGALIFAFGPSFENNLRKVKENKLHYQYDVIAIDKASGEMLKAGVTPNFIVTADARISLSECIDLEKISNKQLKNITLFTCVTSHPSWAKKWKEIGGKCYFYVNKDGIRTHKVFSEFFNYDKDKGDKEAVLLPASTCVGNSAYVIATLLLNYRKDIFLFGYDFSFDIKGNYYGVSNYKNKHRDFEISKKFFDNHQTVIGIDNKLLQTSESMMFAESWLRDFVMQMVSVGYRTINCTGTGILNIPFQAKLREVN